VSRLERLPPRDRRLLLALTEMELAATRRPDLEEAQARVLLADESEEPGRDWWEAALPLIGKILGTPPKLTIDALLALERSHTSADMQPTRLEVTRAVLAHVRDWPELDDAGRQTAIDEQHAETILRPMRVVAVAIDARGLPVCAPELYPPLTWGYGFTNLIMEDFVRLGYLIQTGERRNSWPVYDLPLKERPIDQRTDDDPEVAAGTATSPSPPIPSGFG
jgi:hypothetical protein